MEANVKSVVAFDVLRCDSFMMWMVYLLIVISGALMGCILCPEEPMSGLIFSTWILISVLWFKHYDEQ